MKEVSITFIEIEKWVNENKNEIIGSKIKKVKQKENIFDFQLYKRKNFHLIVFLPFFLFLRKNGIRVEKPTNFCFQLRKILENEEILDVFPKEFERIVIIQTKNYRVIIELFSEGNIIVEKDKILAAYVQREWKDREVFVGKEYKFPPSRNLLKLNFLNILSEINKFEKNIASFIASEFGLGSYYSNKILSELKIENKSCKEISSGELDFIIRKINEIIESKNYCVLENNIIIVDSFSKKEFERINDAFERVYNILISRKEKKKEEEIKRKIERIEEEKKRKKEEIVKEINDISKKIEILEKNSYELQKIIERIKELRDVKIEWQDLKNIVKKEFRNLKEINENSGKFKVEINGIEIELFFIKNLKEQLSEFYEKRKKLREKLNKLEELKIEIETKEKEEKEEKEEKKWYEKFRWFISSDGYLVLAGKDAETNEILIKKYSRDYDYVLHVDIHGSPFVLVRNDKKSEVPLQTLYEAAQFAACYSKAWQIGVNVIDVYCVRPYQLKKDNLPKGSFFVEGKRIWFEKVKLRLSIGVIIENNKLTIRAAPPVALRKQTQYIITLVPGKRSATELAKEVKAHFVSIVPFEFKKLVEEIREEEISRLIPYGTGELVKL
jgi:predicted ribosome quality control (RQC) complex YloA/Tae2 family protein